MILYDAASLAVTALQLGQFLPQHYEMAVKKSAVGVSPWLLFFNSLYTYLVALELILVDTTVCTASHFRCFMHAQPLIQMVGAAFLCATMWYWFLKYYDANHNQADAFKPPPYFTPQLAPVTFFNAFLFISAAFTAVGFALLQIFGRTSYPLVTYAQWCGLLAAALNAIMWIPQIYVTASYGHKGDVSVWWVLSSVLMDVVYSVYLARMGEHWTVWANNVPDGVQTTVLLLLILRLEYLDDIAGVDDYGNPIHQHAHETDMPMQPDESQPLLFRTDPRHRDQLQQV
ncbi:hypothetical protein BWQ96_05731 [Gracilariopsis chorda]|uniref:Cystinosin-like n=1 Tax=Gracilariopsis chorda TaxID=448386 RepID=A0A2V3IR34_9FLOR|nr:hypothetical protein BWQ96_05731 [Gracilariopsis chorda]|eukprot:PXF44553.1 hypothetical protein BWQ96_05731 [Gracilariopsis chorda]